MNTLSQRLNYAIKATAVTQAELARKIGIKSQVVQYLCSSNAKASRFTFELAHALKISVEWLASGKGNMLLEGDPLHSLIQTQTSLPVLSWQQLHLLVKKVPLDLKAHENWVLTSSNNISKKGFAVRLSDKSMWPRLDQNTLVIIEPNRKATNGDFVMAYIKTIDEVMLREYYITEAQQLIVPINKQMFKEINLSESDEILGVMVETRWYI